MPPLKRTSFRASGPFQFRRDATVGGVSFKSGQIAQREELVALNDRKLELLYDAKWIDVADDVSSVQTSGPSQAAVEPASSQGADGGVAGNSSISAPDGVPAPETAPEAAGEGGAPVSPQAAASVADTAPSGGVVAYKSFGFGRHFAINAAGEKIGEQLTKAQAQSLSARDRVPLLGQSEGLKG